MKDKTERSNQTSTELTSACVRLHQLLSIPPKKSIEMNRGRRFPQLTVGTGGLQATIQPDLETKTFNENSNQITRAMAACQLGLFVHPSDQNTYVAGREDLQQTIKTSLAK